MTMTNVPTALAGDGDDDEIARLHAMYAHVTADVEVITPAIARRMLEGNLVNRELRKQRVDSYARQMSLGRWRLTGETIIFGPDGQLLQGQHRLHGCIQSGVSFVTIVVRGVDPEAMRVIDTGMPRNAADVFRFEGIEQAGWQASMVRQIIAIKSGIQQNTLAQSVRIDRDDLVNFYNEHVELLSHATRLGGPAYLALKHSRSGWGVVAFLLAEADVELSGVFMTALATGADLAPLDPRLALRKYCFNRSMQRRRVEWVELVATAIKAWNFWIDAKEVDRLQGWNRGQQWPEVKR